MKLVVATHNAGKLREYRALLSDLALELRSLADYPDPPDIEEIGETYLANARAKAHALAAYCQLAALADDSGLEVDALNGQPGVRSARFATDAGLPGGDRSNVALLLDRLSGVPDQLRTARFRCVIVVARPDGRELVAEDTCEGRIIHAPRGSGGFGFDPVFLYPPLQRTFAELVAAEKDRVSHRARAVRRLAPSLCAFLSE